MSADRPLFRIRYTAPPEPPHSSWVKDGGQDADVWEGPKDDAEGNAADLRLHHPEGTYEVVAMPEEVSVRDNPHLIDGEFQSDKYPTTPRGKVPLSTGDPMAQDLLWVYAQRRRTLDEAFSAAVEEAVRRKGYAAPAKATFSAGEVKFHLDAKDQQLAALKEKLVAALAELGLSPARINALVAS